MRKVNVIPTAAMMPNCRAGGRSLMTFDPNPKTVVPVTMKKATSD